MQLSGPGVGLWLAQYLFPTELTNAPPDFSSNRQGLAAGEAFPLGAGDWYVDLGMYSILQYLDPISGQWNQGVTGGWTGGLSFVKSDGFNARIANMTGCPVGANVTAAGSNYVQSSTNITPSAGTSQWNPIIGGALTVTTIAVAGSGYGLPPLLLIAAPPPPSVNPNGVGGIAAAAYAVLTGSSVTGVSWINQGAGYAVAPSCVVVTNPTDPNISSGITPATITLGLTGAGTLTGAICVNSGIALTNTQMNTGLTLSISGAGSGATVAPVVMQTVTGLETITTAGAGYAAPLLTTQGGVPAASTLVTPTSLNLAWRPRPAQIKLSTGGGTGIVSIATIYDGGLFTGTPTPLILNPGITTTVATVTLQMGAANDHVLIQQAP